MQNYQSTAIITALGGNEQSGFCLCPAHNDRNTPNLRVTASNDGKILVKCFAGCSQEAVIGALKNRGLWPKSGKQVEHERRQSEWQRKQEAEEDRERKRLRALGILRQAGHNSSDLTLVRHYLTSRRIKTVPDNVRLLTARQSRELFGRNFPAMAFAIISIENGVQGAHVTHLSRDGESKLNTTKPKKIYGTLRGGYVVVSTLDPEQTLIVGEGIESTLSACQITGFPGIAALSAYNLPNIIRPPCRDIIICGDNDDTGHKFAEAAARKWALSKKVRIAIPDKWNDWNDVLRRDVRNETDRLQWRQLILSAKTEKADDNVQALGMERFMDLEFPPRKFLLQPWLTMAALGMIDALPGHGKTYLALSIGYAVASGHALMDWFVRKTGRVLYVDGELPGRVLQDRLQQLGPPLPAKTFRVLSRAQFEILNLSMIDLGTQEGREFLDQMIEHYHIDLVILDSISTLVRSGVDNDVESWRAIQDWSLKHRARGRTVIYLHHHGRSGNPRGTSAREIVLDARIKLTKDDNLSTNDRSAFKLEFPKAREFFGDDAAPRMTFLSIPDGTVTWRTEAIKPAISEQVEELSESGLKQSEIARELKLSKSRISQIMSRKRSKVR